MPQRREAMTPQDLKAVRSDAVLGLVAGSIGLCVLGFFSWLAITLTIAGIQNPDVTRPIVIIGIIFSLVIVSGFAAIIVFLRRHWFALHLTEKVVYSGKVTGKRWYTTSGMKGSTGGSSTTWHFCAALNGVEFEIEREDYEMLKEGDEADFHCSTPGNVFRVIRTVQSKRKTANDDDKIEIRIGGIPVTFKVDGEILVRFVAFGGVSLLILVPMLVATAFWWFSGNPPTSLLFFGKRASMQVAESRLEQAKDTSGLFKPVIEVSSLPVQTTSQVDDDDEPPPRKKFPLRAYPGENTYSEKPIAQQALSAYPRGKIIDTFTFSEADGNFFAVRYSLKTIIAAVAILLTGFGGIFFAAYRFFLKGRKV